MLHPYDLHCLVRIFASNEFWGFCSEEMSFEANMLLFYCFRSFQQRHSSFTHRTILRQTLSPSCFKLILVSISALCSETPMYVGASPRRDLANIPSISGCPWKVRILLLVDWKTWDSSARGINPGAGFVIFRRWNSWRYCEQSGGAALQNKIQM